MTATIDRYSLLLYSCDTVSDQADHLCGVIGGQTCTASRDLFCLGSPLSTVIGRLDDQGALKFTGLSMLSGPPLGQTAATAGRFVEVAIAGGADGYRYFFGTIGGPQRPGVRLCGAADERYRHSYVRLARMLPRNIANSSNGRPAGIEYWVQATDGATWKSTDESAATPLFADATACIGEVGMSARSCPMGK
jgi:hypothetical protein